MAKPAKMIIPSETSQKRIIELAQRILTEHRKFDSYYAKMEAIDVAYARYKRAVNSVNGVVQGQGVDSATTPVGIMNLPSTTPPVVVSQVDSMVAYLAEVFLSGTPMFPVVSSPATKKIAEQLETLLDDHATIGGYARQFLLFLLDGVKYNFSAVEVSWDSIPQYSIDQELLSPGVNKVNKSPKYFTKVTRRDPYNTVWDHNVAPGDISAEGDYAGYISILSRTKLKRKLQRLTEEENGFNLREAMQSNPFNTSEQLGYYRTPPQVSNYVSARKPVSGMDWFAYAGEKNSNPVANSGNFEIFTFYARILPIELALNAPGPKTAQIWKFTTINSSVVVEARRVISAYDYLPMLFGQPLEDGLDYQTQSVAEGNIPFQEAADTLFNISFNSARRAVSDRALYNPTLISPSDINAPVPAPKIPVRSNSLDPNFRIQDAYHQIPFDARGTEGALQSGMQVVSFGKELSGLNQPMQGQFQKGNKSVQEWNDTMGGAEGRLRLRALVLEHQVFQPLKNMLKLNIFQYGEDIELVSQKTGENVKVNIQELRDSVLSFRLADGYTPKSKLASTDALISAMQMISQSPILSQAYGPMLPGMYSHMLQLMGVRGAEEYTPKPNQVVGNVRDMNQATLPPTSQPIQQPPTGVSQ